MIVIHDEITDGAEARVSYVCDSCGKERDYLSDSWSELFIITDRSVITDPDRPGWDQRGVPIPLVHHCLECRSDKKEYRPT